MTAMAHKAPPISIGIPRWLIQAVLILVLGLAVLALREAGLLAPGVTLPIGPHGPGALDLVGRTIG